MRLRRLPRIRLTAAPVAVPDRGTAIMHLMGDGRLPLITDDPADFRCKAGTTVNEDGHCTWHPRHYWCTTCLGYYGVPHDGIHEDNGINAPHPYGSSTPSQCACRPCKTHTGRT